MRIYHVIMRVALTLFLGGLISGCRLLSRSHRDCPPPSKEGVEVSYEWLVPGRTNAMVFVVSERHTNGHPRISHVRLSSTNAVFHLDPTFEPRLGTYHYKVSWRGVGVGDARVTVGRDGEMHTIEMKAGTGRKLDLFYKVRYRGKAVMRADEIESVEAEIEARVKNRKRHTRLTFQEDGDVDFVLTKSKKGKVRGVESATIKPGGFALDPLSAACLVRRLDWAVGEDAVFDVVTGKSYYELHLTCTGVERVKVAGRKREAWVVVPVLRKLDMDEAHKVKEQEDNINKSSVKIYIATDGTKDVLKIVGHHKVGAIKAEIEKFEPAPLQDDFEPNKQESAEPALRTGITPS